MNQRYICCPPPPEYPLVSVLVANHNYGEFLPDAVRSVCEQTYETWELLIVDDGSTDDSRCVLSRLEESDGRIRVFHKANGGQSSAWNLAYQHSHGDIICFLDADDLMVATKLEVVVQAFRASPQAGYAYHRYTLADRLGNPLGTVQPGDMLAGHLHDVARDSGGYAIHTNALVSSLRRELAGRLFPLPEQLGQFGDRYIGNLTPFLTEIVAIPDCLAYYRIHGANHSGAIGLHVDSLRIVVDAIDSIFPHQRRYLESVFGKEFAKQVRLRDVRAYWEHMAAMYVLGDRTSPSVEGHTLDEIRENLRGSYRYYVWMILFMLPAPVSRALLHRWWRNASWKRFARPIARGLRMR